MIEPVYLRNTLGHFATGVAVVTTAYGDREKAGVTINSFNSVSLEPGVVQFSLGHGIRSLPHFLAGRHYAINFLSSDQIDMSRRFARSGHDKWSGHACRPNANGAPILDGCIAHIDCERMNVIDVGDHAVFFCHVRAIDTDPSKDPLVFFKGQYCVLSPQNV